MCVQLLSCYIKECNEVSIASIYWSAEQLLWTMIIKDTTIVLKFFPGFISDSIISIPRTLAFRDAQ